MHSITYSLDRQITNYLHQQRGSTEHMALNKDGFVSGLCLLALRYLSALLCCCVIKFLNSSAAEQPRLVPAGVEQKATKQHSHCCAAAWRNGKLPSEQAPEVSAPSKQPDQCCSTQGTRGHCSSLHHLLLTAAIQPPAQPDVKRLSSEHITAGMGESQECFWLQFVPMHPAIDS